MTKPKNGGHHHLPGRDGWLPPLTPTTVIGMALFFFFTLQVITTHPFQHRGRALRSGGFDEEQNAREWKGTFLKVSKKSHAYLQQVLWDYGPSGFINNVSRQADASIAAGPKQLADQPSYYASHIAEYLKPWKESGITKNLVEDAAEMYDICDGEMIRAQVLNGSLWVYHITDRANGWYPAILGPGNVAAKGRIPYAMLSIMHALHAFPGQIPDVDFVMHTADFACIKRKWAHGSVPLPIMGYQGSVRDYDIPMPDYSYWGHEHQYIQDPWGHPAHGWDTQSEVLHRKYANVSILDRVPQAMWRGRTKDKQYPHRDRLRRKYVECADTLRAAGMRKDTALLNVKSPAVALQDGCDYRYQVYIESLAWTTNLKQKMVCGSVLVAMKMEYWEWFAPAMAAGREYVEITNEEDHICEQMAEVVGDMNAAFDAWGRSALSSTGELTPTLEAQLQAMRKDRALSKLLTPSMPVEQPQPVAGGNYSWGSTLMPWEVAANGQRFMREHVRLEDTLLYVRDLLRRYAALLKFKVKPLPKSICYTGDLLLEQFATPHKVDGEEVAQAYPWLKSYDGGCTTAEAAWGNY